MQKACAFVLPAAKGSVMNALNVGPLSLPILDFVLSVAHFAVQVGLAKPNIKSRQPGRRLTAPTAALWIHRDTDIAVNAGPNLVFPALIVAL
jgi:hypothetical protein